MNTSHIIRYRLVNQQIAATTFTTTQQMVAYMGAMQSQDFAMAKWALGLRLPGTTETDIEKDFNEGKILRTHIMRPTWHFVAPADVRWMQSATSHRVLALLKTYYKMFGITTTMCTKAKDVFAKVLQGNKHMTRTELQAELKNAKIIAEKERLAHIVMDAELHNVICSGPRVGKQFTYALLDERAPKAKKLSKDEALAELTKRYFTARGPATIKDYAWWSGLTIKEAKEGIDLLGKKLFREEINGQEYFFTGNAPQLSKNAQTTFLMPDYDEYGISYKDRSAIFAPENRKHITDTRGDYMPFTHVAIIDGIAAASWRATTKAKTITVETTPFKPLNKTQQQKLDKAVKKYIAFFSEK